MGTGGETLLFAQARLPATSSAPAPSGAFGFGASGRLQTHEKSFDAMLPSPSSHVASYTLFEAQVSGVGCALAAAAARARPTSCVSAVFAGCASSQCCSTQLQLSIARRSLRP